MTWVDGDTYEGFFQDNCIQGEGTYTSTKDGFVYKGSWWRGMKDGRGALTHKNGIKYTGEFRFNKKQGQGLQENKNFTYEGSWN